MGFEVIKKSLIQELEDFFLYIPSPAKAHDMLQDFLLKFGRSHGFRAVSSYPLYGSKKFIVDVAWFRLDRIAALFEIDRRATPDSYLKLRDSVPAFHIIFGEMEKREVTLGNVAILYFPISSAYLNLHIRLEPKIVKRIDLFARKKGLTRSEVIRIALAHHLVGSV